MGTKILHSADLHLAKDKPETITALKEILAIAKKEKVELITLGGDLFHSSSDANDLRSEIRNLFSNLDFDIISIPGNHDVDVFKQEFDFGSNFISIIKDYNVILRDKFSITAIPYIDNISDEELHEIEKQKKKDKINLLLLHCTLDIGFCTDDLGEEPKYCPISKAKLSKLGYNFILAGHFHKKTEIINLDNSSFFLYPGSPVSHSKKELGKRNVILIDIENNKASKIELNTFYYDKLEITVYPGKENDAIAEIKSWIENKSENCCLEVIINGFIQQDEKKFGKNINSISDKVDFSLNYKTVKDVLKHSLYKRFLKKLKEKSFSNEDLHESLVIDIISDLLSNRELRE